MKPLPLFSALLLSVSPSIADGMASEWMKGYNYGYIYGLGNALCGLAIDKRIEEEYAQDLLSETLKALSSNLEDRPYVPDMRKAYRAIAEDVVCKEVYQ